MWNWTKVFLRYCDGGSFSGMNMTVENFEDTSLYWRGGYVREAIEKISLRIKDWVKSLICGVRMQCGRLATYLHTDQWCDALHDQNPSGKCVGLPTMDSSWITKIQSGMHSEIEYDHNARATINGDYHCGLKWTFEVQNATMGINQTVSRHTRVMTWKCMFAEHSSEHIRSPVFALQSQYDSWQTEMFKDSRW